MDHNHYDFDLFVIGGGSGGVRAARMAAQHGARVALAEAGALGGTCVNVGCIPKKLYAYAAHYRHDFAEARGFGWQSEVPAFDWATLKDRRAAEIRRLNGVYQQILESAGVQLLRGWAQLEGAHGVRLDGARYSARHILVATGGRPSVPPVEGRELVLTSDDMFDLEPFPRRLAVVGGGYIASEFASIFNGLGAEVTQIYRGAQLLRGFDDDVRSFLGIEMGKAGVRLRLREEVAAVRRAGGALALTLASGEELQADAVLYATGRVPNVEGLGLAEAGVRQGRDGAIEVDAHYRTSVPSIHALGDVTARVQLTPVALGEAMALVDHLFGQGRRRMGYEGIPTAVFTQPNVATVGDTEAQAREKYGRILVFKTDFKPLKHTLSGSAERTFMKLLVDAASDRVVGLHMVGPDAGEVIQGFAVALQAGATKAQFDATIGIHPTAAEEFVTLRTPVAQPAPATAGAQ
jgi:glutathione reductase (NADPH)